MMTQAQKRTHKTSQANNQRYIRCTHGGVQVSIGAPIFLTPRILAAVRTSAPKIVGACWHLFIIDVFELLETTKL